MNENLNQTILRQITTHFAGTQDIIKIESLCGPCGFKSGVKMVAFLLRLSIDTSIYMRYFYANHCLLPINLTPSSTDTA